MRKILALTAILAVMLTVLISCKKNCTNHTDRDNDGKCDTCGIPYTPPCTAHTDSDKNGKCDTCGADVQTPCTSHTDSDENGKCDTCGADVQTPCTSHTDSDENGKCDTCGADVTPGGGIPGVGGSTGGEVELPWDDF